MVACVWLCAAGLASRCARAKFLALALFIIRFVKTIGGNHDQRN